MIQYYFGKPSQTLIDWCKRKYGETETKEGKWTLYDKQGTNIAEMKKWIESGASRIWEDENEQQTNVIFSGTRYQPIPFWSFRYNRVQFQMITTDINNPKLKTLEVKDPGT